jgi:hypothetical protein
MKKLTSLLSTATALEAEIAGLTEQQVTLTADVEKLTSTGDVSDKALDALVTKRGRLDLLPSAIAKREERLTQLIIEVRAAARPGCGLCRAELRAREEAGHTQLDAALTPLLPESKGRVEIVAEAVPLLPAVRAASALCSVADSAATYNSAGLPEARAFVAAVDQYAKTSKFIVEFP